MATQQERRRTTRRKLIDAARVRFSADGYQATATETILAGAGVSKGALYHHYDSKRALFEEVFEEVAREAIEAAIQAGTVADSPLEALVETCLAWLREARKPRRSRILLELGPSVLGFERARDIEARYSLRGIEESLRRAEARGELCLESVPVSARLLNALLAEAALVGLERPHRGHRREIERTVRAFIEGLRTS